MLWRNCFAFIFASVQWAVAPARQLQDWFIATCYFSFTGRWTISQLTLLSSTGASSSRPAALKEKRAKWYSVIVEAILHNIKQITSGCQHVPASKHTSRHGRWPRIHQRRHRQDQWAEWGEGLLVLIVFSLQTFCNTSACPRERCDDVLISTGRQAVKKMKMHSGFTHVELRGWAFAQRKDTF